MRKFLSHQRIVLSVVKLVVVTITFVVFFNPGTLVAADPDTIAAEPSRVDNPAAFLPIDVTYAHVGQRAPVYRTLDDVRAGTPFTSHGGSNTWVSVHQSADVEGRTFHRVRWNWGTSGWMPADNLRFSAPLSSLRGVDLRDRPGRWAMAFTPVNVRSEPGVITPATYIGMLERYDLISIEEERVVADAVWYRIAEAQWVHSGYVRTFDSAGRPEGVGPDERWVEVNVSEQIVIAHEGDVPVFATLTSTGRPGYRTPTGLFRSWIALKYAPMRWSNAIPPYNLGDVPWIQYFNGGVGLHGVYWHDNFGTVQSAGCVNLSPHDANWLFAWMTLTVPDGQRWVRASAENPGTWVWVH